jgi:polysaccharide export outer membrane protein
MRLFMKLYGQIIKHCIGAGLCLVILAGCTPHPSKVVEAEAAAAAVATADPTNYLLGPEDVVEVSVWKEPDLTKQLVVRPDGKISYPLIGEIHAAGLTVKQLQGEILKRLEKFVTNANVTVILLKTQYYKVYVTGMVNKPGEFLVGRPVTALQAIAMAGGLTPFAAPRRIVILRQGESFSFDYKAVARGESLQQNRILMPGDVVVVP